MLAIIGGSGLTQLANLQVMRRKTVSTPYGRPSGPLIFGKMQGRAVVFLARHGANHTIPPHAVNYRANLWALHAQKVKDVVSVATVGGIRAGRNAPQAQGHLGPGREALGHRHRRGLDLRSEVPQGQKARLARDGLR